MTPSQRTSSDLAVDTLGVEQSRSRSDKYFFATLFADTGANQHRRVGRQRDSARMAASGRVFTDSAGHCWTVIEVHPASAAVDDSGWLAFISDNDIRRIWNYPADWRGLSAAELETIGRETEG
jgi:hypothetical protein